MIPCKADEPDSHAVETLQIFHFPVHRTSVLQCKDAGYLSRRPVGVDIFHATGRRKRIGIAHNRIAENLQVLFYIGFVLRQKKARYLL